MLGQVKTNAAKASRRAHFRKQLICVTKLVKETHESVQVVKLKLKLLSAILVCVVLYEFLTVVYLCSYRQENRVGFGSESLARTKRESAVLENTVNQGSELSVEFVNPKLRQEFEEKEKQNGNGKGENSTNNPWVWLTSYSRVPVKRTYLIHLVVIKLILYLEICKAFLLEI